MGCMSTVGIRLRELRLAKGLSQLALSGDGISPGYVSLIESGKRNPSAAVLRRLADRLGVPVDQLLDPESAPQPDTSAMQHGKLEVNFARLALANGNPAEAVRCLAAVALDKVDSQTACDAALVLAESLQQTGQLDRAVGVLETLIGRARAEQAWVTLATASTVTAVMYIEAGDIARSTEVAQRALTEVEAAGLVGTDEHIRLASVLVSALVERGDFVFASRHMEDLLEVADRVGSSRARGSVYWNAGALAHERGRLNDAVRLTNRAVALLGEEDLSRDLPRLRMHYAWLLLNSPVPLPVEALSQLDRAESDPSLAGSRLDLGTAATFRGRAHLLLGQVDEAAECAARALQLLGPSEHIERVSALLLLGDVGSIQLDMDLALESYREAEQVLSVMKDSRRGAQLWRQLGDSWRELGELQRAVVAYDRSFTLVGLAPRPMSQRAPGRHQRGAHVSRS